MIIGIAFLILIGFLLYYWLRPRGTYTRVRDDPLEVAKGRLARGEITVQEYEEIKKRLVG